MAPTLRPSAIMTEFVTGCRGPGGIGIAQHNTLPMEMRMKIAASALVLAVLISNPAAATKFDMNDHHFTHIVHTEVVGASHTKTGTGK